MNQSELSEALASAKYHYCALHWQEVVNYFGDDVAEEFDFFSSFPYDEVYERGEEKECTAFYHIAAIQRFLVGFLFDLETDVEAQINFVFFEVKMTRLSDRVKKVEHLWVN